jgi:hypothetical protein
MFALASCGGKSAGNRSGNGAGDTLTTQNGASNADAADALANPPAITPADPNETHLALEALPVSSPAPGTVMGSVRVVRSASGIESDGFGGGCLTFEDPASKQCHKDADCHVPGYVPAAAGPYAFCADSKCWIKPGEKAFCWKSRYATPPEPLTVGQAKSTPPVKLASLPAQLFTGPAKNQIKARVIACLNGKYDAGNAAPCAGGLGKRADAIGAATTLTK